MVGYKLPFPPRHNYDGEVLKRYSQPFCLLFDHMSPSIDVEARRTAMEICESSKKEGSPNQILFASCIRWLARRNFNYPGSVELAEAELRFCFTSQHDLRPFHGYMSMYDRKEPNSQAYIDAHVAAAAFVVRHASGTLKQAALDWLKTTVALHEACRWGDKFYVACLRGRLNWVNIEVIMNLLQAKNPGVSEQYFGCNNNPAGIPNNIGPWALRELIRAREVDIPVMADDSDLPYEPLDMHIVRGPWGVMSWMHGLENAPDAERITPVSGIINGKELVVHDRRKSVHDFPNALWPMSALPMQIDKHIVLTYNTRTISPSAQAAGPSSLPPPKEKPPQPVPPVKEKRTWLDRLRDWL